MGTRRVPNEIVQGPYGPRLVLRGQWSPAIDSLVHRESIEELELNHGKLWADNNVEFVCRYPYLKALILLNHHSLIDPRPVECLNELRFLDLGVYTDETVDFGNFPHLEECLIEWNRGFGSALSVVGLKRLVVNRLPKREIGKVASLINLHSLGILSCGAESLEALSQVPHLRSLRLTRFLKLRDNAFLQSLNELRELWVQSSCGFQSLESLSKCTKLESVTLDNVGLIESLRPLVALKSLRSLVIMGRSNVLDGDFSVIESLPILERFVK